MGKKTLYKNAALITGDSARPYIDGGFVLEEDGFIKAVGTGADPLPEADAVCDLRGLFLMPGLISTHYHFYGQFARGMSLHKPTVNWQQVLKNMWWDMDRMLDDDATYHSAMMGAVEGVRYGLTTYFDHQASPNAIDGSLDRIEEALKTVGARAALAYEVTDRNGKEGALAGIRENVRYIKKHANDSGKFKGLFGLHASYTLDDDTLETCAAEGNAIGAGFHTHLAEDRADVADSYKFYNIHPAQRMLDRKILSDKTICAHVVHVGAAEIEILKESGVTVAHNVQSNTNNAVGQCPVEDMLNAGVHVAVGGDGYHYNLFNELSIAGMMQHLRAGTPAVFGGDHFMKLAFENPARLAEKTFGYRLGQITEGAAADLLIIDYDAPTPVNANNWSGHLLSGMGDCVDTVIIGGEKVVEHRKFVNLDEKEVFAKTREAAARVWKKMETV